MKQVKILAFIIAFFCGGFAFADFYADFADYDAGKSQKWFHFLRKESFKDGKSAKIEENILRILDNSKISDEAFRLACIILKPIATNNSVETLAKFLSDSKRVAPACDVLAAINSSSANSALIKAFNESKCCLCAGTILNALSRNPDNADFFVEASKNDNLKIQKLATLALANSKGSDAIYALIKIANERDGRFEAACIALCTQSDKCAASSPALARKALAAVPVDFTMSILVRGNVSENPQKFFDELIAKDNDCSDMAGRAVSGKRNFDESKSLLENFSKLSPRAKTMAIGSMMPTKDKRYWKYISAELDSENEILKEEAIYSARFLCEDEADLKKILSIMRGGKKSMSTLARNVLLENESPTVDKILKAEGDKLDAMELLCLRGDSEAQRLLLNKFLAGEFKNGKLASTLEKTINYGNVKDFALNLKKTSDDELRMAIGRIIIKTIAAAKGAGNSKPFMQKAINETIGANTASGDKLRKLAESRLGVKITN